MKPDDIIDAQRLHLQHHGSQVASLHLWHRRFVQLPVTLLRVETVSLAGANSPSPPRPLLG